MRTARRAIRLSARLGFFGILLAAGLEATGLGATAPQAQIQQNSTVVYLVRDAGLTHIHTTDFKRTRDTAAPIAERLGIKPRPYDSSELEGLAEQLRATPGRHLVSGRSNTTPLLVRLLRGESTDIPDPEYDRLYIVTLNPDGTAGTILLRYGSP